ncbi:MAG: ABC transporter permease [Synergistaceae bacterium]|nr:ABC transporter permease [Synergistaceae bacterium]
MFAYILNNRVKYVALVAQHITLTLSALFLCFVIGVAVGTLCFKNRFFNGIATSAASSLRVVPSIATMLILMPIMGTGFPPALTALVILGLPPVIINTARALESVDPCVIEAAYACAMSEWRVFRKIRMPLAAPLVITGLRISGLSIAAGATLAAYIGAGGLGELILSGLSQYRADILSAGAVTTMAISLSIEGVFQLLYAYSTGYKNRAWRR